MAYCREDFLVLRVRLNRSLRDQSGEPLSCQLYDCDSAAGSLSLIDDYGDEVEFHVAEACNIANLITSLDRILSLPRSNIACSDMSEIFLISLDVLREYIQAASEPDRYQETEADKNIRAWAGFIKHPQRYVFAHRCLSDSYEDANPETATISTNYLRSWDGLNRREKDARKADLAHRIVAVELPSVDEVSEFYNSCAKHLQVLIKSENKSI
ncbi:hypothetical protein [Sulfitobacter sp.]|uniref:hypothetical protein n=1 Tax=Sulfitobacter sp. TaxID=1903071 RepID=UPI003562A6EC